jgi:hypothetical protein
MKIKPQQFKNPSVNANPSASASKSAGLNPFFGAQTSRVGQTSFAAKTPSSTSSQFQAPTSGSGNIVPSMAGGASAKIPGGFSQANHIAFA